MPVVVTLVICGAMAVQSLLGVDTNAELSAFVAIPVGHLRRWTPCTTQARVVAPIGAMTILCVLVVTSTEAVADAAFVGFFVLSAFLLGRAVELRTLEARRQAGRAALAEAAGEERACEAIEAERQRIAASCTTSSPTRSA